MTTNPQSPSRRKFLGRGCLTAAAIGVTVCGGGTAAALYQPKINLITNSYGKNEMNNRVLILYATKAGSTAEIAAKMGEVLASQNLSADVRPVAKAGDLTPYRTIILGSAIRMGRVLPEVQSFVQANQSVLQQKSFNMFVVCMTLNEDTPANRQVVSAYLDPVRALANPASEGLFAGVIDPSKVSLLERLLMAAMKVPQGDFRKWDQITAWAQAIPASLS